MFPDLKNTFEPYDHKNKTVYAAEILGCCFSTHRLTFIFSIRINFSSDFRNENNEMFVLGVSFFFFWQVSTFYLAILRKYFYIIQKISLSWA